jgi:hypothetical protein
MLEIPPAAAKAEARSRRPAATAPVNTLDAAGFPLTGAPAGTYYAVTPHAAGFAHADPRTSPHGPINSCQDAPAVAARGSTRYSGNRSSKRRGP